MESPAVAQFTCRGGHPLRDLNRPLLSHHDLKRFRAVQVNRPYLFEADNHVGRKGVDVSGWVLLPQNLISA